MTPSSAAVMLAASAFVVGWTSFSAWWFISVPHFGHVIPPEVECLVAHGDGAKEERLGLVRLTKVPEQASEVVEALRRVGMLGAKHLLLDRQRALMERPRPREVALGPQQGCEVLKSQLH